MRLRSSGVMMIPYPTFMEAKAVMVFKGFSFVAVFNKEISFVRHLTVASIDMLG